MNNILLYVQPFEWQIMEWFYKIGNQSLNYLFWLVSYLGTSIAMFIIIGVVYWCLDKEKGLKIAFICFFNIGVNCFLKNIFKALRPFQYKDKEYLRKLKDSSLSDSATGTSFPSGHSQNAGSIYGSLIHFYKKKTIIILSLIALIIVPISRLYLGVHFPRDVATGIVLSIMSVFIFAQIEKYYNKYPNLFYLVVILLLIINCLIYQNTDSWRALGLIVGLFIAQILEKKIIFKKVKSIKKRILRFLLGISITIITYIVISIINKLAVSISLWLANITYFATHIVLIIIMLAFVPFLYNKISYLRSEEN